MSDAADAGPSGPAPNPRADRQRRLIRFLRVAATAVFVLALVSLLLPGEAGRVAADLMVVVVVGAPIVRVLWLAQRWTRRKDWRFVAAAAGLLLVVATGAAVGLLAG
jgi:hypothetical protein